MVALITLSSKVMIHYNDIEAEFLTTLGTDTVDGGAGTDTLTFSAAGIFNNC